MQGNQVMTEDRAASVKTVAVLGAGAMGQALAPGMIATGWRVLGYDPSPEAVAGFVAAGGLPRDGLQDAVREADIVISLLPGEAALSATSAGLKDIGGGGRLWIEASTLASASKDRARSISEESGWRMYDAPISGTAEQCRSGQGVGFLSGPVEWVAEVENLFRGVLARTHYCGAFGAGVATKLVANLLVTLHTVAASDALRLARGLGLDPEGVIAAIASGPASSAMFEARGPRMATGFYRPAAGALAVIAKDLDLIAAAADSVGCDLTLLSAARGPIDLAARDDPAADLAYLHAFSGRTS